MNAIKSLLVLIFCVALPCACTSSGTGGLHSSTIPSAQRRVFLHPNADERAKEFIPELVSTLRRAGYDVTSERSAPYSVELVFSGGGFDLNCSIIMSRQGIPVVSGRGVNPGWGVWAARGRAYHGVFSAALDQFSERLGARR